MMRRPEFLMMRRHALPPQKSGSNGLYITTFQRAQGRKCDNPTAA
jgi:hypothetical protein